MFTIGEFSKITGMTVKTLRFYHDKGILLPSHVDADTGYRYYSESSVETARVISALRNLDFGLADVAEVLKQYDDDSDIVEFLERQRETIQQRMNEDRRISRSLDQIITKEREASDAMQEPDSQIKETTLEDVLIAGVRMTGKYRDCGKGFAQIGRQFGRHICGKPFLLHYDEEYREDDADFEACMPVRKGESAGGVSVRNLPGGRCVTLLHRGPYEELGRSYEKLFSYLNKNGYRFEIPTREVYIKGPGMVFRGNPKKYLTEIQIMLKP